MKLKRREKQRLVAALSYAIAETPTVRAKAEYTNLRKKIENALRTEDA